MASKVFEVVEDNDQQIRYDVRDAVGFIDSHVMYGDTVIHMEFSRTLNTMSIIQTGATMRKGSLTRYFGHLEVSSKLS